MTTNAQRRSLEQRINDFEDQNPRLSEAMRLFGMTMHAYQAAMTAMYGPRISVGSSTTRLDTADIVPTPMVGMWQTGTSTIW